MLILILHHLVVEHKGGIFLFLFSNGVVDIKRCLFAPVSNIALCEYGGD